MQRALKLPCAVSTFVKVGLNVQVVLLPEGEDPDSYSKKMGTEFQRYWKPHNRFYFIQDRSLSSDASRDQLRKQAIREIVTSIALIPDPIAIVLHSETSDLLKIQESVLLLSWTKSSSRSERSVTRSGCGRSASHCLMLCRNLLPRETDKHDDADGARGDKAFAELFWEHSWEDVDLVSYFIGEFEELDFFNPLYASIFKIFKMQSCEGVDWPMYLVKNGSEEIKRLVAELTVKKHQASKYWREKYPLIFFMRMKRWWGTHQNVLRRKYRYVQNLLEEKWKLKKLRN